MSVEKDKVEPQEDKEFGRAFVKTAPTAAATASAAGSVPEKATQPTQKSITRRVATKRRVLLRSESFNEDGDEVDLANPDDGSDDEIFDSGVEGYAEGQSSDSAASNQRSGNGAGSDTRRGMPGRDRRLERGESGVSDDDICRSFEQEEVLGLDPVSTSKKAEQEVSDV